MIKTSGSVWLFVLATAATAQNSPITTKSGTIAAPPAGKGEIVFWRPGTMLGAALGCTVHEGDKQVARLGAGKYWVVVAEPGKHEYFVEGDRTDRLNLEVEADETYFVRCSIGASIGAGGANLSPSDLATFAAKAKGMTMWKGPSSQ